MTLHYICLATLFARLHVIKINEIIKIKWLIGNILALNFRWSLVIC